MYRSKCHMGDSDNTILDQSVHTHPSNFHSYIVCARVKYVTSLPSQ